MTNWYFDVFTTQSNKENENRIKDEVKVERAMRYFTLTPMTPMFYLNNLDSVNAVGERTLKCGPQFSRPHRRED